MNLYDTNIVDLTCTCPDWLESRSHYLLTDPRRLCKHIINKLEPEHLPPQIHKFKESILFYKEKGWGFKKDFDEIIELGEFTLLNTLDWIDVFDKNSVRYAVKIDDISGDVYWAKNMIPNGYQIIENYLAGEVKKIPKPLSRGQYPQIAKLIKEVMPHKKDFYITFDESQYIPTPDGRIYDIYESRLTPTEKKELLKELSKKYDEHEAHNKLGEASMTPITEEHEYWIYEPLLVTDRELVVTMYSGKKYIFDRASMTFKGIIES